MKSLLKARISLRSYYKQKTSMTVSSGIVIIECRVQSYSHWDFDTSKNT